MLPLVLAQDQVIQTHVVQSSQGFAVGWFTLALINAGLAQNKGHGALLWWAVSLFLGPIATFIIVAVLERRPFEAPYDQPVYPIPTQDPRGQKPEPIDF